jgi:hypothetical protein
VCKYTYSTLYLQSSTNTQSLRCNHSSAFFRIEPIAFITANVLYADCDLCGKHCAYTQPSDAQQHRLAALQRLAALRTAWTAPLCPSLLLRTARHYESAAAAAVAQAVASAVPYSAVMQHPSLSAVTEGTVTGAVHADCVQPLPLVYGIVAVVQAPARVDLAGGWSDTPPICYEVCTIYYMKYLGLV